MPSKASSKTAKQNVEQEPIYVPLKVTAGIIIHIGAGIYHSVAGALKELVTNAYDADATEVIISTGYPHFETIKVVDNGSGMTATRFRQAMATIGSSLKAVIDPERLTPKYQRPIIGKLGIGLMSLSQVCSEAEIESQVEGSDTKFVAKLDFSELLNREEKQTEKLKVDVLKERYGGMKEMRRLLKDPTTPIETKEEIESIIELLKEAGKKNSINHESELEQLGYCMLFPNIPAIPGRHGTTITLTKVQSGVRELLGDVGRLPSALPRRFQKKNYSWADYSDELNKSDWPALCEDLRSEGSEITYALLPKYYQFLYDLSLMTPIAYLPNGPITNATQVLSSKKKELCNFNFSLLVDNKSLLKPVLLPSGVLAKQQDDLEELFDYHIESINFDEVVDGQQLKYTGYIFWQRKQVLPSSIRGLQIHIRNVGIGLYDATFLNFSSVNLSVRAGQMSGEIYVQAGLERALSVNRNSFKETDEHYLALQQHIWKTLGSSTRGEGLLGKSIDSYWRRKERVDDNDQLGHIKYLRALVKSLSGDKFTVSFSDKENEKAFEISEGRLTVYDRSPSWPKSKKDRRLYQRILLPIEIAYKSGTSPSQIIKLLESTLLGSGQNND